MKLLPFESEIGKQFREVVKGNNFITPIIVGYVNTIKGLCEITRGHTLLDLEIFGVTVVSNGVKNNELSKCLNSYKDVENYIDELNHEDYSQLQNLLNEIEI